MEGWGGDFDERDRESPPPGDAEDSTRATGYPVATAKALLVKQRDMMLREVAALENKVAGIDMALAILNDDAPIAGE